MKNLVVFTGMLIALLVLNSCSSNDDESDQNPDKILGVWRLEQLFIDNVDLQVNECEKKTTIEVFENGKYTERDYEYNEALTECTQYDLVNGSWDNLGNSMYSMSDLNASAIKVTFTEKGFIAEYSEEEGGISLTVKAVFIAEKNVVPDPIIGKWKQVQEFLDGEEIELSACDLLETFEFFEDGIFLEEEFEYNETTTECVASPIKTRIWKNIGGSQYILYKLSDDTEEELTITFEGNTMTIELSLEENGVIYDAKFIFSKYVPT